MKLLTLGNYLHGAEGRLKELMGLLLSGIRLHAVGQEGPRFETFQFEIARIEDGLAAAEQVEAISLLTGQALHCIDSYHRAVDQEHKTALSEYKQLTAALTQTVAKMATGNTDSIEKLRVIEKQLGDANTISEIRLLRLEMSDHLNELCEKTVKHREEATRLVSTLRGKLLRNEAPRLAPTEIAKGASPAAGLAGRAAALECIEEAIQAHTCSFAAVLLVDRFPLMAKRFGNAVVDRVQTFASLEIAQRLRATDQMFEWTPGAFVVVLERTDSIELVKGEMKQLCTIKGSKAIEMDNRSVVLPVSISFCLFPLFHAASADAAQKDIEGFIHTQF